jgi:hypothetical protein
MDRSMTPLNDLPFAEPNQIKAQGQALVSPMTKIHIMDFLNGNVDRHRGNLMMNTDIKAPPRVLAIDHGHAFDYHHEEYDDHALHFPHHRNAAANHVGNYGHEITNDGLHVPMKDDEYMTPHGLKWWSEVGQQVRHTFDEHVAQIGDQEARERVHSVFHQRADHLDKLAAGYQNVGQEPTQDQEALNAVRDGAIKAYGKAP